MDRLRDSDASGLRAVLRATLVCLTAFGFDLDPAQIAAVQLLGEAVLAAAVQLSRRPQFPYTPTRRKDT